VTLFFSIITNAPYFRIRRRGH